MSAKIILLIVLMTVVTYLPRAIPSFIVDKIKIGNKTQKFLKLIPYTAMSALVFPGIFTSVGDKYCYGIIGGGVAALLAILKCPVVVCVIVAVAVDFLLLRII